MAKKLAIVFGIVFIVLGVIAYIPNPIVGNGALFNTNTIHNLIHIVSGIIFLIAGSKSESASAKTLGIFGIVYLLVAILGFVYGDAPILGLVSSNLADTLLHVVLAIVFLGVGFGGRSKMMASA